MPGGDSVVEDKLQDLCEGFEAVLVVGLIRGRETVGLQSVREITERAVGGAWFEGS
jgi:hypothetical protein